jgi:flagellar protein FliO/FliZ
MLFRLVFSLAAVLALMALAGRVMGKRQLGGSLVGARQRNAAIRVLGRHGVGRTASVTLVQVGGRVLLLGVTESSIQVLRELGQDEIEQEPEPTDPVRQPLAAKPLSLSSLLETARERTTRRL